MIIVIAQIVFILSILGILFIVIRKLQVLSQLSEEPFTKKFSFRTAFERLRNTIRRFISGHFFQNIFIGNLEKSLRKFKILALKIDNLLDKFIRKLKKNSGNGTPR